MMDINKIEAYDFGYGDLENKLIEVFSQDGPPDFETADELLRLGADVNAEGKDNDNNILSVILDTYPEALIKEPNNAGRYMIQVIQYFLDHGFYVNKNNGRYGAQCLFALVLFQDRSVIEATKLLFHAGTEDVCTETAQTEQGYPSYFLGAEISYQRVCETDYRISNVLEAAYQVYEAKKKHKPYDDIDSYEDVIGKQIKTVMIEKPKKDKALHDVILKNGRLGKCFYTNIYFLFDDRMMIASPDVDFWTDKQDPSIQMIDISSEFSEIIGAKVESIEFSHSSVQTENKNHIQPIATFVMSNKKKVTFSTSFGEVPKDTDTAYFYFGQPIVRKENEPGVEIWWCSGKTDGITSCKFTWSKGGLSYAEDLLSVETQIVPNEIQVRFFNGYGLMSGKIYPLSSQQYQELFDLLEKCREEWKTDDYSVDVCDGSRWKLKLFSKRKCLWTIEGTAENPPHAQKIRDMITKIIGNDDCYVF